MAVSFKFTRICVKSSMNLQVRSFFHAPTFTVSYLVWDAARKHAAIIDSTLDFDQKSGHTGTAFAQGIVDVIKAEGLKVDWILETHVHADHLSAAPFLKSAVGGKTVIGEHVRIVQKTFKEIFNARDLKPDGRAFDKLVRDGEALPLGDIHIKVMHTPGHTPACVSYVIEDAVFVGDTLFMPDYGTARTDFPGGDARTLYRSIRKILALPPETRLFLCHDYKAPGRDDFVWETTVEAQRKTNIHIHDGVSEDAFVALREARDKTLETPVLLLPAIQVNMRAGSLPPPEDNGVRYLKIPLDRL
jgi:glyoxylase-like metal-dependent hydrolase (beta-lactamase superfamily II)